MSRNRSTAVMQRRVEPHDSLDYFPTPPWATRALCEFLRSIGEPIQHLSAWEPACGEMFMANPLAEYFASVRATDIFRYSPNHQICDFLINGPQQPRVNWVVTNPPFVLANRFVTTGLERAAGGVAMFVRSAFTEGGERFAELFGPMPPAFVVQFAERVCLLKGRLVRVGDPDPFSIDEETGELKKASTATSYSWIIWKHGETDTRYRWIPKCRHQLERDGDYPEYSEQWELVRQIQARVAAENGQGALL